MREVRIEGVKIQPSPHKKYNFDYEPGDMRTVFRRGQWRNWNDAIKWLQENGERDNELTPGETIALVEDLRSLAEAKAPFTMDPGEAFKLAHKNRTQNNRRFAQEHEQAVMMARTMRGRR